MPRVARLFLPLGMAGIAACTPPAPPPDPFAATGQLIALGGGEGGAGRACIACHGLAGQGDGRAAPRLAGLDPGYLHRQLDDYASGRREHAAMRDIAGRLDGEARAKVAAYYAALPVPPPGPGVTAARDDLGARLYHRGDPARGLASCASCHGDAGQGGGPANPPLAGQPAPFIAAQLAAWREGRRHNDPMGVMLAISRRLDARDAAAVARHAAGLGAARPPADRGASPEGRRADPRNDASAPPPRAAGS